ncbi:MAG: helix-turn-helix domain-containing protein [Candidatus Dormibacteria bacterium]|jgi:transcriptional regulator with XRE-family HTH domain
MKFEGSPSLAEKLERLFQTVHPAGRPPLSNAEVAAALQRVGGPTVSATYLWQLRRGLRTNPTKAHLEALARFFGVNPGYFFDEVSDTDSQAQLALLAVMRDAGVRAIALASSGLSEASLQAIRGMVENARRLEKLTETRRR